MATSSSYGLVVLAKLYPTQLIGAEAMVADAVNDNLPEVLNITVATAEKLPATGILMIEIFYQMKWRRNITPPTLLHPI